MKGGWRRLSTQDKSEKRRSSCETMKRMYVDGREEETKDRPFSHSLSFSDFNSFSILSLT